ncbi:hypothetical protein C2869_11300 [Saccharobesus litoralis]|uniref:SprA-related family protein n=1 Tax=Saccharobesus litoralis TaxID=2172099 RepID=A0A2S0VS01_9ALTE|nr:putative metalloprotease CJM1_0395 family protein [Saccharobesus litoralis]AWB66987.1 hypothetical protein C2869_11300 [Saccharobesus litoralis]
MNIVTQFPVNLNLNTANPHTEQARKDALARQLIPQTTESENSAAERGLGSDSEKAAGRQQPLTYDYIKSQQQAQAEESRQQDVQNQGEQKDATDDQENRGKDRQQAQQEEQERQQLAELKERDREVKTHEQAHASIGGQYAGSPSYEYEKGPDGNRYAVGGEVKIDVSEVPNDPEATARKMEQVQRAALAPAEPSAQDRRVAAEAASKRQSAQAEMLQDTIESSQNSPDVSAATPSQPSAPAKVIKADAIEAENINVEPVPVFEAKASLAYEETAALNQDNNVTATANSSEATLRFSDTIAQADERITTRALKIQRHYHTNSLPRETHISAYA